MRYIDTGARDASHALGSYFTDILLGSARIAELRVQSGFFGSDSLGYFTGTLSELQKFDGHTRFLVGSNDGQTRPSAVCTLLEAVGPPRSGARIGVVSFQEGFFHPKVFHFVRSDGSSTAYVGSANLTRAGAASLHVEAGIILDTNHGDSSEVLESIANAIDSWFTEDRPGLYEIATTGDVVPLIDAGVLGIAAPPRRDRTIGPASTARHRAQRAHSLAPLVTVPLVNAAAPAESTPTAPAPNSRRAGEGAAASRVHHWSKPLSASDAQRRAGHQSALIALTQGDYRGQINHTTYFRDQLFADAEWRIEETTSKEPLDVADVTMRVSVDGVDHGELAFRVSHSRHRESGTNSPTTELHIEPLLPLFAQTNMTGKTAEIERWADGSFTLMIH